MANIRYWLENDCGKIEGKYDYVEFSTHEEAEVARQKYIAQGEMVEGRIFRLSHEDDRFDTDSRHWK